jgi:lipopolysaccharide/colanic/teichoic acid biosynthesis glycosyltransferase
MWTDFIIRLFDIVVALIASVVFAPIMLLVATAIKLEDRGPVFFRQNRVGRQLVPFSLFKFRSMSQGQELAGSGAVEGQDLSLARAQFQTTVRNDSRITRVGHWIRRTHLDELPQLLNVVFGHMSLVGVRPDTPVQESDYSSEYWTERHRYRPGITGTAQVYAVEELGLADRSEKERWWLSDRSVSLYLKVLMATVTKVARGSSY